jgi:hypothetical protein
VNLGLGHQQPALGLKAVVDLTEQAMLIRDFMDHHESQGEVGLDVNVQAIRLAPTRGDAVGHPRLFCSLPQHVEHLLLEIDGDHPALVADHPCHRDGEPAHPAANIENGHSRPDVSSDDLVWIVEQVAQRIVDEISSPPGADVSSHDFFSLVSVQF